jgi:integrase
VSLRLAIGHDIATVAQDAGHADAVITASVYTHAMRIDEGERDRRSPGRGPRLGTSGHQRLS